MIKCKSCGYSGIYNGSPCPECGCAIAPDSDDIFSARRILDRHSSTKDQEVLLEALHILADTGGKESKRNYAKALECAPSSYKNSNEAMRYYKLAAYENDPYSAYRYSLLAKRTSDAAAAFWLKYAAVIGSVDSYPAVAELFRSEGEEEIASYYYSLASEGDDADSIATMAKRMYEGLGVPRSEAHAKWYLDKLTIPPIHAIKLAYKLRSIAAQEPPRLKFPAYESHLYRLRDIAEASGFDTAYFHITELLAKEGSTDAHARLGMLLAEGKGCKRNAALAEATLISAAGNGTPTAALYLAEGYLTGSFVKKDIGAAFEYFEKAARLGYPAAYERMAQILSDGKLCERDIARAIGLYELAATEGIKSAGERARVLKHTREEYYLNAMRVLSSDKPVSNTVAKEAFRAVAIATAMGHKKAPRALARCYAYGFGTSCDRPRAYIWFKKAVEGGDDEALLPLALCYSRGFGTRFNFRKAVVHLKKAKRLGIQGADAELVSLYRSKARHMVRSLYAKSMELVFMKKHEDAIRLLHSFESLGHPKSLYTLGCLYEFGCGTPTDRRMAARYYELALSGSLEYGSFIDNDQKYKLKILKLIR